MKSLLLAAMGLAVGLAGCTTEAEGGAILPPLRIDAIGPSPIVPGTRLTVKGSGFVVSDVAELAVIFRGAVDGEGVEFAVRPQRVDDETLVVPVAGDVETALIRPAGIFSGRVTVLRTPLVEAEPEDATRPVEFEVSTELVPALADLEPRTMYIGDTVTLSGKRFLHTAEGASLVQFDGTMTTSSPPRVIEISGLQLPAVPPDPETRDTLAFTLTPDVFGIIPGRFAGTVQVVNQTHDGATAASGTLDVSGLELAPSFVEAITPNAASRGQWIAVDGRGFIPPDGLLQAATILILDGQFTAITGQTQRLVGPDALTLVPDRFDANGVAHAVLRVDLNTDGELTGLGLIPGTFTGTVAPLTVFGADSARGVQLPLTFEILPQKQVIYVKLLPGFDGALADFGLLVEKEAVKARILEVLTRDYEGVNVAFTYEIPHDFAEYGVVEVAGNDPNDSGLFGLDNTAGKDVGNVRFDDIVGGYNAETNADGYAAYGGVFPGEFIQLSETLGKSPLKSARFDEIFGGVAPLLGGEPAKLGEGGGRGAQIREAVRVFGNLVGNTVSHEIGHSLGLSAVDGQFHNIGDNPGWIMDSGSARPFSERAEIDGDGPAFFSPVSRAYLEGILPVAE